MRVAIMQPYFMPYAGYFRLLAGADLFVAFDCVQFPRRGWVHRNQLTTAGGESEWLTLPLQKADRDSTRICDLRFRDDAQQEWSDAVRRFPAVRDLAARGGDLAQCALTLARYPVEHILSGMGLVARLLHMERPLIRSSSLGIDPGLRGQDRIIEILRQLRATEYVNAPGGRALYDGRAFRRAGVRLMFLSEYRGGLASILERLALEPPEAVRAEVQANMSMEDASDAVVLPSDHPVSAPERGLPAPGF